MYIVCEDQLIEVNVDPEGDEVTFSPQHLENFYVATDRVLCSTLHRDWTNEYILEELSYDMMF